MISQSSGPPPVLDAQPSSRSVLLNDTTTFSVEVTSSTTLSYQWLKNGSNTIAGATGKTFTLTNVLRTDAASYSVRVINGGGTVFSTNAVLTVLSPPEIAVQPLSQTALPGQTISLSVSANGTAPFYYRWIFNGNSLGFTTNSTLTRTNFNAGYAGNYLVVVSNSFGAATSSVAAVVFQSWVATYNGTANDHDYLTATAVDASGNVYVTGYAKQSASSSYDYVTIKYDPNGTQLWRAVYDSNFSKDDQAYAIAIDASGNVYVTGSSELDSGSGGLDYLTVKYDTNGNQIWAKRYNGTANKDDVACSIGLDKNGNVFVTGSGKNSSSHYQFQTVKYDNAGNQVWAKTYVGSGNLEDDAVSMAIDKDGNLYVTGKSQTLLNGFDCATIKYSNAGVQLWVAKYSGPLLIDDIPTKVVVDTNGNVYVTGKSQGVLGSVDYLTIKYSSSGSQLWTATYNGPANKIDVPSDMALDGQGNVFVTGSSTVTDTKNDFATVKYNSSGEQIWVARYDGSTSDDDQPVALALDSTGDVYVAGQSKTSSTGYDVVTVKYSGSSGAQQWAATYNSSSNINDSAISLALQDDFTILVGAQANNKLDYTTIKYQSRVFYPDITTPPEGQTIALGQSAYMTVTATGTAPLSYQWSRNGVSLLGATNSTLVLSPVQSLNAGNYTVFVTNNFGSITSSPATLVVTNFPIVLSVTPSVSTTEGGFSFGATVPRGATYIVLASTNMVTWVPIVTNVLSETNFIFKDPASTNYNSRFYRVVVR